MVRYILALCYVDIIRSSYGVQVENEKNFPCVIPIKNPQAMVKRSNLLWLLRSFFCFFYDFFAAEYSSIRK
jgi:hypothetical protein